MGDRQQGTLRRVGPEEGEGIQRQVAVYSPRPKHRLQHPGAADRGRGREDPTPSPGEEAGATGLPGGSQTMPLRRIPEPKVCATS